MGSLQVVQVFLSCFFYEARGVVQAFLRCRPLLSHEVEYRVYECVCLIEEVADEFICASVRAEGFDYRDTV